MRSEKIAEVVVTGAEMSLRQMNCRDQCCELSIVKSYYNYFRGQIWCSNITYLSSGSGCGLANYVVATDTWFEPSHQQFLIKP